MALATAFRASVAEPALTDSARQGLAPFRLTAWATPPASRGDHDDRRPARGPLGPRLNEPSVIAARRHSSPAAEALESQAAYDGAQGAALCAVSARDGTTLATCQLDAVPVFDGLAVARGRLDMMSRDGRLRCLADERSLQGGTELQPTSESTN